MIAKKISLRKLKHTTERYLDCMSEDFSNIIDKPIEKSFSKVISSSKTIGLAPFAAHESKVWPIKNYNEIFSKFHDYKFIIFAFGEKEISRAMEILKNKNCSLIDSKMSIDNQLKLINSLDLFITMDSANMHLGCLTNTDVISIWGPTHHFLGFGPLFNFHNIVEISITDMPCRPCSVYGKINSKSKKCGLDSMEKISPEMVIKKIEKCLNI